MIFGYRRLRAVQEILGCETIIAGIIPMNRIVAGEYAENMIRKEFTPTERCAIAIAIETEIGHRQGQRTDLRLPENIPEVEPGAETREIAAKRAGLGNARTFDQVKQVMAGATEEIRKQMDSGELSISAAAVIAREEPDRQREISAMNKRQQRLAVREIRRRARGPRLHSVANQRRSRSRAIAPSSGALRDEQDISSLSAALNTLLDLLGSTERAAHLATVVRVREGQIAQKCLEVVAHLQSFAADLGGGSREIDNPEAFRALHPATREMERQYLAMATPSAGDDAGPATPITAEFTSVPDPETEAQIEAARRVAEDLATALSPPPAAPPDSA